jgi:membrane protease YdiL (CAAX protease family)
VKALAAFFGFSYLVAWIFFVAGGVARGSPTLAPLSGLLFYLGAITPGVVAVAITARSEGMPGVAALVTRLLAWRVRWRWYLFAIAFFAAVKLAAAVLHRIITGDWPAFGTDRWYVMLPVIFIAALLGGQAGEEVGWRGFALPRLAARFGLGAASVVLGVIWAVWHLPTFFIPGVDKIGQSLPVYVLQVTALSVTLAWLYWKTDGSLLLVTLMHSAVNQTKDIVPSAMPGASDVFSFTASTMSWLTAAVLWTCAAVFLVRMRGARLTLASDR